MSSRGDTTIPFCREGYMNPEFAHFLKPSRFPPFLFSSLVVGCMAWSGNFFFCLATDLPVIICPEVNNSSFDSRRTQHWVVCFSLIRFVDPAPLQSASMLRTIVGLRGVASRV